MTDLAQFGTRESAAAGAVMHVVNPATRAELFTKDGQPITITLASSDSDRVREVSRRSTNKRLAQQRGGRNAVVTAEALEADAINALMAATIAWQGIAIGGEVLELNDANVRRAYTELPWLRRQVDEFVADEGNFVKTSPAS